MEANKKRRSIKSKILMIPLICVFIGILIIGAMSSYFTQQAMIEEMEDNAYASAEQVISQVESNMAAINALNNSMEDQLRSLGNILIANQGQINDGYLTALAAQTGIDQIYWYNPQGTIISAANGTYVGWTVTEDHPIYAFMQSGDSELMEEVRQDSESGRYYKYGYIKDSSGYFMQAGIPAEEVIALTERFDYQVLLEKLAASDQINFASFIDSDLMVVADTNQENIGSSFADVEAMRKAAIDGEIVSEEIVDKGEDVFLVTYPVVINDTLVGALNIGYSMETVQAAITRNMLMIAITGLIIFGILGLVLYKVSDSISKPVQKVSEIIKEISKGHLSVRANMDLDDEVGEMADTMDVFVDELQNVVIASMNRIADGDVSMDFEIKDEQDEITPALKTMIEAVRGLIAEMSELSTAAVEGKLQTRGNADKFKGGFKEVVEGVNETIEALVGPLNVAAGCIEEIGKGKIPQKITAEYQGDFDTLKKSINASIDGLGALEEGNRVLTMMSQNDLSRSIENDYQGIYGEIGSAINIVHDQLVKIVEIANNIKDGDLSDLEMLQGIGKRSEQDNLVPSLIGMIENIRLLVEETQGMAVKAVEGDLNSRGDETKIPGEYANVIIGFNQTLDAVTHPIQEALSVLEQLAQGNLNVMMEGNYQGDHASIKEGLNQTIENLRRYVSEISDTLEKMSSGDLDHDITSQYDGDFLAIKMALNQISIRLSTTMSDIINAAFEVESGSKQISDGAQALAQGTTQQASSIQELTASIENISNETKLNAVNANNANERAVNVRSNAEVGNDQMENMMEAMKAINESSNSISNIIKVIDDIAFQTNILSLNAAVEAARAGEHGKGFAVVAEEVRTLAGRSAEAAKETTELIETSIEKVDIGTKIAIETAESLKQILNEIGEVTELVSNIAQASNGQATEIAQVSIGIEQVSEVVQVNSATAEESAASSEELSSQAQMLKEMISRFKIKN